EGGTISVEYWSSNGESANKIPMGASLISYKSSNVLSNSCFFITSTYAGRNKMNEREKMEEYKKSLLIHNRVVTREDLKLFMQTELSERARSIEYMNTYIKSDRPNEGFIQCIQIVITPEPGKLELAEWDQLLISLQLKLQKQSVNNIPYHLKLSSS
ncbi:MAG TPA: hypothetical protein VFV08_04570, partial [Puia sp.]|nr:hypothetical protein [Puia sp.]